MVLIGLLLAAVVCLILGLTLSSQAWLIGSLVFSILAAVMLVRSWSRISQGRSKDGDGGKPSGPAHAKSFRSKAKVSAKSDSAASEAAGSGKAESDRAESEPAKSNTAEPASSAVSVAQDSPLAASSAAADVEPDPSDAPSASTGAGAAGSSDVLVVDGKPDYHAPGCARLEGEDAEKIPLTQALEDGFAACTTCSAPSEKGASEQSAPAVNEAAPVVAQSVAGEVWVVDGKPDYHEHGCSVLRDAEAEAIPREQAIEDGFAPCQVCKPEPASDADADGDAAAVAPVSPGNGSKADVETSRSDSGRADAEKADAQKPDRRNARVWVADGYPEYHMKGCGELAGLAQEEVPYGQAVEDGFQPCVVCNPDSVFAGPSDLPATPPERATDPTRQVWVADGYPDYHEDGCSRLGGLESEAVPYAQAVEDGFTPCSACQPKSAESGGGGPTAGADDPGNGSDPPTRVWVVDGFPDYHRQGCSELEGLTSEAVPRDQAVEDGFGGCTVCAPDRDQSEPTDERTPEVRVVDGHPFYHRAWCSELEGLDDEPVPHAQAVEDGFTPCTVCTPDDSDGDASSDDASDGTLSEVSVIDGRPHYHRSECSELEGHEGESIPYDQAVEDGFTPCSVCRPDGSDEKDGDADKTAASEAVTATTDDGQKSFSETALETRSEPEAETKSEPEAKVEPEPEPEPSTKFEPDQGSAPAPGLIPTVPSATAASESSTAVPSETAATTKDEPARATQASDQVFVIEGRPRFHAQECLIIKGQPVRGMTREKADEGGYQSCSLCQRREA